MKPKIYIFVVGRFGEDYSMIAVAEDGEEVAWHVSSTVDYGKYDMGLVGSSQGPATKKHDLYRAKYPDGYELKWVEDWKTHPVLSRIGEENRKTALGKEEPMASPNRESVFERADRLEAECKDLKALLREWLQTPFFSTQEAWVAWVSEFRPRVEAALGKEKL